MCYDILDTLQLLFMVNTCCYTMNVIVGRLTYMQMQNVAEPETNAVTEYDVIDYRAHLCSAHSNHCCVSLSRRVFSVQI